MVMQQADFPSTARLKTRTGFVRMTHKAQKVHTRAFVLQLTLKPGAYIEAKPTPNQPALVTVGYTATRKVGNAVMRNRAKRRLRAAFDAVVRLNPQFAAPQPFTLVIVAREAAASVPFDQLKRDLQQALAQHAGCSFGAVGKNVNI